MRSIYHRSWPIAERFRSLFFFKERGSFSFVVVVVEPTSTSIDFPPAARRPLYIFAVK